MDSSEKLSSSSSSHPIQGSNPNMTDHDNFKVVPAKKIKLSTSTDDSLKIERSDEDVTETGKVNEVVLLSPNSSRSPEDFVFSIDHILESIFMKCDRKTLLSCRLVSRRWAVHGSKELQKTVVIKFTKVIHFGRRISRTVRYISDSGETGSMGELITLMNSSAEFPSNYFDFGSDEPRGPRRPSSNMEIAQEFFNVHGASVKKIIFRQDLYVEDLKQLLLNQAPNLQQLCLDRINVEYKNYSETKEQQPQQEQAGRQELFFDETTLNPKPILKNLKVFKCHFLSDLPSPDTLIQQILECSPNLIDVSLPMDQLHFFVQPVIRLALLKKLIIEIHSINIDAYELIASSIQENMNLWAVCELYCVIVQDGGVAVADEEAFSARATNIMRIILNACSATCRKLMWGMKVENLEIPQMQQLRHLTLEYNLDGQAPSHGLPVGVSLGDTFPNLKSLEVRTYVGMEDLPIGNIFSDEDPTPAANVKTVTLKIRRPPGEILLQSFRDMFPNAHIRIDIVNDPQCEDEDYEVEIEDAGSDN